MTNLCAFVLMFTAGIGAASFVWLLWRSPSRREMRRSNTKHTNTMTIHATIDVAEGTEYGGGQR